MKSIILIFCKVEICAYKNILCTVNILEKLENQKNL